VKQGDYQIIHAEDGQMISPLEFAKTVRPGMTLEMSIVLRRRTTLPHSKMQCPQCEYIHSTINTAYGWIEWQVASNLIYVTCGEYYPLQSQLLWEV
jgi:hypothetical protein